MSNCAHLPLFISFLLTIIYITQASAEITQSHPLDIATKFLEVVFSTSLLAINSYCHWFLNLPQISPLISLYSEANLKNSLIQPWNSILFSWLSSRFLSRVGSWVGDVIKVLGIIEEDLGCSNTNILKLNISSSSLWKSSSHHTIRFCSLSLCLSFPSLNDLSLPSLLSFLPPLLQILLHFSCTVVWTSLWFYFFSITTSGLNLLNSKLKILLWKLSL